MLDLLLPLGLVLIIASLLMRIRKRKQREAAEEAEAEAAHVEPPAPAIGLSRRRPEPAYRRQQARPTVADQRELETEALVRRFVAHLDAKARMLEILIDRADERISELRALRDELERTPASGGEEGEPAQEKGPTVSKPSGRSVSVEGL